MNPYYIDEPTSISFSGGRTSAYMLYQVLEANNGVPNDMVVTFANTGREMPQTLDFVHACSAHWGVPIVWLELAGMKRTIIENKERAELDKSFKIVDYDTASRNGEPFKILLDGIPSQPNAVMRTCTAYLKIHAMRWYLDELGWERPHVQMIGIRADEMRRAAKIQANPVADGSERVLPLVQAGVTKYTVGDFWEKQAFDLKLPNNNGTTDWGNCDLCFLKSFQKKISIIRARPDLADWWIKREEESQQPFRKDHPDYKHMLRLSAETADMFSDIDDESIPCFCGD